MSNLTPVMIWAATYFLHSTLLLGGVWCWFRWKEPRSHAFRETVWKLATAGGFVTASLQLGLGIESPINYAARTAWITPPAAVVSTVPLPSVDVAPLPVSPFENHEVPEEHFTFTEAPAEMDPGPARLLEYDLDEDVTQATPIAVTPLPATVAFADSPVVETAPVAPHQAASVLANIGWGLSSSLIGLFAAMGGAMVALSGWGLIRLVSEHAEFRQRLSQCRSITSGKSREILDQLLQQAGVRRSVTLLMSEDDLEPGACGWLRWQIVLPARAAADLSTSELRALLAHELAHLVRGDQWWLLLGRLLVVCFGWQPLNRIALREWQRASEYLCDAWAVQRHVERLSLARCLTTVAEWRLASMATIAGLGSGNASNLTQRVERLIDDASLADPWQRYSRQHLLSAAGSLVAIVMVAYAPAATWAAPTPRDNEQLVDQQAESVAFDSFGKADVNSSASASGQAHLLDFQAAEQSVPLQVQLLPTRSAETAHQTPPQLIIGIELIRVIQQQVSVDMRELNAELQALEAAISEIPTTPRRPLWESQLQRFRQRVTNMERLHEAILLPM